jgi:uncharacterized protein GlcG (DUF336 family)
LGPRRVSCEPGYIGQLVTIGVALRLPLPVTLAAVAGDSAVAERAMPRSHDTFTLEDAKRMLAAAEAKATSIGQPYNVAVVDAAGHLLAFVRQDGALIGSIDLAIDKATTARLCDRSTAELAKLSQPCAPLFGIDQTNAGRVVIFGGGIPVIIDGRIVGAVGTSAGTVEQDIAVAVAALAGLSPERDTRCSGTPRSGQRPERTHR